MSKNLKLEQFVNVFEDGKFFRASKAVVKKIESGCIHLKSNSVWCDEFKTRKYKRERKGVFYNVETNNILYLNQFRESWKDNLDDSEYCRYLLDNSTLLSFEKWKSI